MRSRKLAGGYPLERHPFFAIRTKQEFRIPSPLSLAIALFGDTRVEALSAPLSRELAKGLRPLFFLFLRFFWIGQGPTPTPFSCFGLSSTQLWSKSRSSLLSRA
ncbi:hypothetical protein M5K25_009653 [Dendrobium thyrsiflorum]|uniref:Uncharacterized protein n=1 Tax=Dendrobium thyrsiflorum TaxID=117978 RepID=A0ABD0V7D6_DENTH